MLNCCTSLEKWVMVTMNTEQHEEATDELGGVKLHSPLILTHNYLVYLLVLS